MTQDPSGLLERVPELRPLCDDARVRAAVEGGDPFAVYRALVLGRLTGRLRKHREAVRNLVRNRRLFAKPMKPGSGPFLGTFNGFGATLLGATEKDGTTHIATHFAVGLFFLPLFPFGAYVVAPGQGDALRRSWRLFARVPLTLGTWLWQRTLSLAALAAILYAGYGAFHATRNHTVHVLNGFPEPIHVTMGTATLDIPPGGRQVADLPVGTVQGKASVASGLQVDQQQIRVKSGGHTLLWNVAGASPLVLASIPYTAGSTDTSTSKGTPPVIYCGQPVVSLTDVDFRFVEPPSSVSMPKGSKLVIKKLLTIAPTHGKAGIDLCSSYLLGTGKVKEAVTLLELSGRLSGWSSETVPALLAASWALDPDHAFPLAEEALKAKPDSVLLHRVYQTMVSYRMPETDLVARYRARAEATPGSADAQYLHVRLLRGPDGLQAVRAASARFPDSPDLLRLLVHAEASSGHWKQAQDAWQRLAKLAPEHAGDVVDDGVIALVAQGRVPEARSRLDQGFEGWDGSAQARAAVLDARLASLSRASDGERLVRKVEGSTQDAVLRVRAGLPGALESAPASALERFQRAVLKDPSLVPSLAASLESGDVAHLSQAEWGLAWCECARLGNQACRRNLERSLRETAYELSGVAAFVRGEASSLETLMLDPTLRVAALVARSRLPSLGNDERAQLVADARRADWVHDQITDALPAWTRTAAR